MILTATPQPQGGPPSVVLSMTEVAATTVEVERQDRDGRWRPVREAEPYRVPGGGTTARVADIECPFQTLVTYRAWEGGDRGGYVFASAALEVDAAWVVPPGLPGLAVRFEARSSSEQPFVRSIGARSTGVNSVVQRAIGARLPAVYTEGPRTAPGYQVQLRTQTLEQEQVLFELLDTGRPVLVNVPPGWGLSLTHEWVHVADSVSEHLTAAGTDPRRVWTWACQVVARPAGGIRAQWSYGDAQDAHATYGAAEDTYPTYGDAELGAA